MNIIPANETEKNVIIIKLCFAQTCFGRTVVFITHNDVTP